MKCPICGEEVISVISNINRPADILGCDKCLPPEQYNEDLVEIFDSDPEWEAYKEEEDAEEGNFFYWLDYSIKENDAVEEYHATRR